VYSLSPVLKLSIGEHPEEPTGQNRKWHKGVGATSFSEDTFSGNIAELIFSASLTGASLARE
jgi:hypothetical protein